MKRVYTAIVITLLVIIAFLLREVNLYFFDICIGVVTVFASLEVAKLLTNAQKKNQVIPAILFPSLAYIMLLIGINWSWGIGKLLVAECLLLVLFFIAIVVFYCCQWNKTTIEKKLDCYDGHTFKYILKIAMDTMFNLVYPTLFLLAFVLLNHLDGFAEIGNIATFDGALGFVVLLFVIVSTVASDVCALYTGQLIKGKKLAPSISPNKTISGCIGGIVGSVLISIVLYLIVCVEPYVANGFAVANITIWTFVVYGVLASVVSQIGDLFESKLKRIAGVKDSGKILPGHGGLMDRLDAITFNVLFTLIFFIIIL